MKYHYELTEGEFIALLDTVKYVAKTIAKTKLKLAKQRAANLPNLAASRVAPAEADNDEPGIAEPATGATVTPLRVVPAPVVEAEVEPTPEETDRRMKVLHGKDLWIALVGVWRENFGVEDAPQPNRVGNLTAVLNPMTFAYLRTKAGLTDATREAIYLLDGGDPDADVKRLGKSQLREARLIAENIAQVASFHAPDLADQLEYSYEFRTIPSED